MFSSSREVHMSIKDRSIRFIIAGKNNSFFDYGQKCLPEGIIQEGQIKDRDTFVMLLEEMVADWKLKGRKLSFCIPDSIVIVRKVQIPPDVLEDEIIGYLYMELGESIHLPFDDPVLEAVLVGDHTFNREVILIASRESVLNDFTSVFKEVSLKPKVADLSMLSIYRTYYHAGLSNREDHLLLVQMGLDSMLLTVFHQDQPIFVRHYPIEFSEEEIEVVKNRSGKEFFSWIGSTDSLIRKIKDVTVEIEQFLSYYRFNFTNGKQAITKMVVTGDHPCTETFLNELSISIEMNIQSFLDPLFQTKKGTNIPAVYLECIGLALK